MKKIHTEQTPKAIWPYSQAVLVWDTLYSSWQIGLNPKTMELVEWVENQTHQVCKNLKAVVESAWFSLENVVKTTIFLSNIEDFKIVNEIYWQYFSHKPARSTIQVAKLPLWALIEIEIIAVKN